MGMLARSPGSTSSAHTLTAMPTVSTDARLLRDYHPVELVHAGDVLAVGARVFVTDAAVLVYQADEQRNVVHTHTLPIDRDALIAAHRGTLQGSLEVPLVDGSTLWINRARGCGCGSPLKAMERPASW